MTAEGSGSTKGSERSASSHLSSSCAISGGISRQEDASTTEVKMEEIDVEVWQDFLGVLTGELERHTTFLSRAEDSVSEDRHRVIEMTAEGGEEGVNQEQRHMLERAVEHEGTSIGPVLPVQSAMESYSRLQSDGGSENLCQTIVPGEGRASEVGRVAAEELNQDQGLNEPSSPTSTNEELRGQLKRKASGDDVLPLTKSQAKVQNGKSKMPREENQIGKENADFWVEVNLPAAHNAIKQKVNHAPGKITGKPSRAVLKERSVNAAHVQSKSRKARSSGREIATKVATKNAKLAKATVQKRQKAVVTTLTARQKDLLRPTELQKEESSRNVTLPETLDSTFRKALKKMINAKESTREADNIVLLLDMIAYFEESLQEVDKTRHQLLVKGCTRTSMSRVINFKINDTDALQRSLMLLFSRVLQWCAGLKISGVKSGMNAGQAVDAMEYIDDLVEKVTPENRWTILRRMHAFKGVNSDIKLLRRHQRLIKGIVAAIGERRLRP